MAIWARLNHSRVSHSEAVQNTRAMFQATRKAGVRRVIHISISNPGLDSPFKYFQGKAELEKSESGNTMRLDSLAPDLPGY